MSKLTDLIEAITAAADEPVEPKEARRLAKAILSIVNQPKPKTGPSYEKVWPYKTSAEALADLPSHEEAVSWNSNLPTLHIRIGNTCYKADPKYIGKNPGEGLMAYDLRRRGYDLFMPSAEYDPTSHNGFHFADKCWAGEEGL